MASTVATTGKFKTVIPTEPKALSSSSYNYSLVPECPTCGGSYESEHGVKVHHKRTHDESIAGEPVDCDWCDETFYKKPSYIERYENLFCCRECKDNFHSDYMEGRERPEHAELMSEMHSGEDNPMYGVRQEDAPNWQGGTEMDQGWRHTAKWYETRRDVLERDGYDCQDCGVSESLHAHHIKPVAMGGAKFDMENLITLCEEHHYERHRK